MKAFGDLPADLLNRLTTVFQDCGFAGASLSKISGSTGLIKASLYHRFPGGKRDMAEAVMANLDRHFSEHVLEPVSQEGSPSERLTEVASRIRKFYGNGKRACLLEKLSLGGEPSALRTHVQQSLAFWVDAFMRLAVESGYSAVEAKRRAEDAVAAVEGALVISRIQDSTQPFDRVIESLPERLLLQSAER